jgi:sphinganine-1-phosphate aldolase
LDWVIIVGWNLNTLQNPAAIHICVTLLTVPATDAFLADLGKSIAEVKAQKGKSQGTAAIYGMAASIPDKSLVGDVAKGYLDLLTKA